MNRHWVVGVILLSFAWPVWAQSPSQPATDTAIRSQAIEPLEAPKASASAGSSVRLVGRKGDAYAVNPDGTVIAIPKQRLVFRNQAAVSMTKPSADTAPAAEEAASAETPAGEPPAGDAPVEETPGEGEPAPASDTEEPEPAGEEPQGQPAEQSAEEPTPADSEGESGNIPPPGARSAQADGNPGPVEKKEADPAQVARIRRLQGLNSWFYSEDGKPLSASDIDRMVQEGDVSKIRAHDIYQQQYDFGAEKDDTNRSSGDGNWLP